MATIEERANKIYIQREEKTYFDVVYNQRNEERKNIYIKGAEEQEPITRKEVTDQVCELLITALNEGLLETSDIGKLNMWMRDQLAKNANSKNN